MKNKRMTILITLAVVIALFSGCSIDINPSVANTQFGMQALHYEFIIVLISLIGGIGCIIAWNNPNNTRIYGLNRMDSRSIRIYVQINQRLSRNRINDYRFLVNFKKSTEHKSKETKLINMQHYLLTCKPTENF